MIRRCEEDNEDNEDDDDEADLPLPDILVQHSTAEFYQRHKDQVGYLTDNLFDSESCTNAASYSHSFIRLK